MRSRSGRSLRTAACVVRGRLMHPSGAIWAVRLGAPFTERASSAPVLHFLSVCRSVARVSCRSAGGMIFASLEVVVLPIICAETGRVVNNGRLV